MSTATAPDLGTELPLGQRTWRQKLVGANVFWIALVLVVLCVVFSVLAPHAFPTLFNAQTTLIETSVLLILSVGMTFVIITAGIDLSVGSVLIFASMMAGKTLNTLGVNGDPTNEGWGPIMVGLLVAVVSGTAWGLLNGLLIAKARIPPLVVTLGSFGAALGAADLLNNGSDIETVPKILNTTLGYGTSFGIVPNMVLISHNMPEVLAVADRIEVLRLGRRVAKFTTATLEDLVGAMTGALSQEDV